MRKKFSLSILFLFFTASALNIFGQINNVRYFNEKLAVKALTEIVAAQETYRATTGNGNYGSVSDLRNAGFIDEALASGEKYGYYFLFSHTVQTPSTNASFKVSATPQRYRKTGIRSFFTDNTGEVHGADKNGEAATSDDPFLDSCRIIESSNEKCVIKDLRLLLSAQMTFQATVGNGNFGSFDRLYAAGLISRRLSLFHVHDYSFGYFYRDRTSESPASIKMFATPVTYGTSGTRSFFIDDSGVLRGADKNGQRADENDPPITD